MSYKQECTDNLKYDPKTNKKNNFPTEFVSHNIAFWHSICLTRNVSQLVKYRLTVSKKRAIY